MTRWITVRTSGGNNLCGLYALQTSLNGIGDGLFNIYRLQNTVVRQRKRQQAGNEEQSATFRRIYNKIFSHIPTCICCTGPGIPSKRQIIFKNNGNTIVIEDESDTTL